MRGKMQINLKTFHFVVPQPAMPLLAEEAFLAGQPCCVRTPLFT
jgi:hypothetical protein